MKKILFCGGGSAGHVIPNIALIEQLDEYSISYIGTGGIEENICKINGIDFHKFEAVKFVRGKVLCNLSIPVKLLKSIKQAGKILDEIKPDLLFCKGGYVCIPPAIAAKKRKIPILAHESDIEAGLANRLIAPKCKKMLTSFPSTAEKFKNGKFVGSPMRENLFGRDSYKAKKDLGIDPSRPTVLVFGGGSGSKIINENIREIAFELCKAVNILHLCGKGNKVDTNIYGYMQIEFAEDMGKIYACSDYAVARCGSNSAFELIALKIPTLFIPLENKSSRGDQVKNAEYFYNIGLCEVLKERDLSPQSIKQSIMGLMHNNKIKTALENSNFKCGTDAIKTEVERTLRQQS